VGKKRQGEAYFTLTFLAVIILDHPPPAGLFRWTDMPPENWLWPTSSMGRSCGGVIGIRELMIFFFIPVRLST
jgi:hypothetical protein